MQIGVLSDTHGLLRPEVLMALAGCDQILHAGDVGDAAILEQLRGVGPLAVVRGNVDAGPVLGRLPLAATGRFQNLVWKMTHRPEDIPPAWFHEAGLIVHGHTHRPAAQQRGDCLLLNPGSCGPRRFHLPVSLAILRLAGSRVVPHFVTLEGERSSS